MNHLIYILTLCPVLTFGQTNFKKQVDSLKFVKEMPFICPGGILENKMTTGCGDDLYWKVVKQKDSVIQLLIEKLDDATTTEASVPMYGYKYTVADIAYVAIEEIIHEIPKFKLLGVKENKSGKYASSDRPYWKCVNRGIKNRQKFKKAVQKWYDKNKDNLVWQMSNYFSSCDCGGQHPNGGHYKLKDKQ